VHGIIQGPSQLTELVKTTDGASTGAVLVGPSAPVNGGQDCGDLTASPVMARR